MTIPYKRLQRRKVPRADGDVQVSDDLKPGKRWKGGDPDWIRTSDPQIRNLMLYPTELRDHAADT